MEDRGLAHYTVRNHLAPILLAWRYMVENFPDEIPPLPRLRRSVGPPTEIVCLRSSEVAALLDWLREQCPGLYPIACLQALAGLRGLEATALRRQDIDLERGLLTVAKTDF